jgi:hypothetical protein
MRTTVLGVCSQTVCASAFRCAGVLKSNIISQLSSPRPHSSPLLQIIQAIYTSAVSSRLHVSRVSRTRPRATAPAAVAVPPRPRYPHCRPCSCHHQDQRGGRAAGGVGVRHQ